MLAIKKAASGNKGNLLELCIDAMRLRATVGEVSSSLEEVFGRYEARFECFVLLDL